jgi:hypothetical protein
MKRIRKQESNTIIVTLNTITVTLSHFEGAKAPACLLLLLQGGAGGNQEEASGRQGNTHKHTHINLASIVVQDLVPAVLKIALMVSLRARPIVSYMCDCVCVCVSAFFHYCKEVREATKEKYPDAKVRNTPAIE